MCGVVAAVAAYKNQGDVYIKRRSGQGAAVYEARCAELGFIPCTQVLQQLESSRANMAHCNLGAGAASALASALAANSAISCLDLRDNNLDGMVRKEREEEEGDEDEDEDEEGEDEEGDASH